MPIPQKEGEFVIKGCGRGIVAYVNPELVAKPFANTPRNDKCGVGGPKQDRKLQHIYKKGVYQGTTGCEDCYFHQPGTEPQKNFAAKIKEIIEALG